jgi:hypothetical protein
LYVEDREEYSGEEGGYVVMCFDCAWADEYAYMTFNEAAGRRDNLNVSTQAEGTP